MKCADAKESWLEEKCHESKNLKDCSSKEMARCIKKILGASLNPLLKGIRASNSSLSTDPANIVNP